VYKKSNDIERSSWILINRKTLFNFLFISTGTTIGDSMAIFVLGKYQLQRKLYLVPYRVDLDTNCDSCVTKQIATYTLYSLK